MADLYPASLINVSDLHVERAGTVGDYGAESSFSDIIAAAAGLAIVDRTSDEISDVDGSRLSLIANVYVRTTLGAAVRAGDVASWSDDSGSVVRERVVRVAPWQNGSDDFGIQLRIGRRVD